jgi:hypothetical protein
MAYFIELLFIFHILAVFIITLIKLFNIFHKGTIYNMVYSWLLFFSVILTWFLGLIMVMFDYSTAIYGVMFKMTTLLFVLNILFLIIEILINMTGLFTENVKPYMSKSS